MEVVLKNGFVCDPLSNWEKEADIYIKGSRIEAIAPSIDREDIPYLNVKGKVVFPGLIDMHVHLREPGQEAKETIASGCAAAVAGGFTAVACMPNTSPIIDNKELVSYILYRAESADLARVYPIGAITKGLEGREISSMAEMAQEGVVAYSDDGSPVMDSGVMKNAMQFARVLGLPVISHCEDLTLSGGGVVNAGYMGYKFGLPVIPSSAEAVMVCREILLQQEVKGKLHLAHLSTWQSAALLKWAHELGINVTAEVTPHHLHLTDEILSSFNRDVKVNPPLRGREDKEFLLKALKEGNIEVIATDHAPHTMQDKKDDFVKAPFGAIGLETAFPLIWTQYVENKQLSITQTVNAFSGAPARILGVPGGTLKPGSPADLVVVSPSREKTVDKNMFFSKARNTLFDGMKLQGWPVLTMVGGDIKMWEGSVKGFCEDFPTDINAVLSKGLS